MSDWEIKQAIRETIDGYSGAVGRLDMDAFLSFFLPDAEVTGAGPLLGLPDPFIGHAGIRAGFGPAIEAMAWIVQMNTTTSIDLAQDRRSARTVTNLVEMAQRPDAPQVVLIARYEDELVLTGDGWKFRRRRLVPLRFSQVP